MSVIKAKNKIQGITLIEAMITLTIATILISIATPSFNNWIRSTEIRSTAESLRAALQKTRAEAISRNASVRFTLTNSNGRVNWSITCPRASRTCPENIKSNNASDNSMVRVGITKDNTAPPLNTALNSGNSLPAKITFSATGTAPNIANGTEITRIDITHSNSSLRLVLLIGFGGMIKLCNPALSETRPESC